MTGFGWQKLVSIQLGVLRKARKQAQQEKKGAGNGKVEKTHFRF